MLRWMVVSVLVLAGCAPATQAPPAPTPAPPEQPRAAAPMRPPAATLTPPPGFRQAIALGTRTETGEPGPDYWQNGAEYTMELRVLPDEQRLEGAVTIRYHNRSPDALNGIALELTQNFHAPGAMRLEPVEVTGGVELGRVLVNGSEVQSGAGATGPGAYQVDGTSLLISLPEPLSPGGSAELTIDWSFRIPGEGAGGRMGHSRDNLIHLAYFYPQVSVYDDVQGWNIDPFLGTAEFYADFARYDVTVEAPAGWLVMGTGALTNPEDVLAPEIASRLQLALQSDTVVHVVTAADVDAATRSSSGTQRWRFAADSVRDVAYSLTRESLWDATRTPVGDRDGDGSVDYARVDAIYRSTAPLWVDVAEYARHAVSFLSDFTDMPYPWPHMSVVEGGGIIGGGMEFPMITLIGEYTTAGPDALYNVTAHEIAHMWVPMIVSSNERRYAWMDEGTTNFNENQSREDLTPEATPETADRTSYLNVARAEQEGEIMRRSDYHYPGPAYVVATYYKPSAMLTTLRGLLGEEVFLRAYHTFLDRWKYKHPYPWDLWNTFEDVTGRDLGWFWHAWYYETGVLDQAVESVTSGAEGTEVVIMAIGENPMPTPLSITLSDGSTIEREIPVGEWLDGSRSNRLVVPGTVVRVEIDPDHLFPDADRENNVWEG